jgi:hypothetical protein
LAAISPSSSRSRFLQNTVASHTIAAMVRDNATDAALMK